MPYIEQITDFDNLLDKKHSNGYYGYSAGCLNCPSFGYGISIFIAGNVVTNYDLTLEFSVTLNPT